MTNKLLFEFLADKQNNTLTIRREFAASPALVWDCYTKSELLDQWFSPKPLTTRTKSMDFREGGHWHYVMLEPNGAAYWSRLDYLTIRPVENYTALDGFCDEEGYLDPQLPRASWEVSVREFDDNSIVQTVVTYKSISDLETVMQMGMEQGIMSTLEKLDELLIILKSS
jgi:uncharacterized protein YndB with AHSA1/START domain